MIKDYRRLAVPVFLLCVASCDKSTSAPTPLPTVTATATLNPNNNLSALVDAQVANADSARVVSINGSSHFPLTPFFSAAQSPVRIPVLGLRSLTTYSLAVEVLGSGGSATSTPIAFTTGDLPAKLKPVRIATVSGVNTTGYLYASMIFPTTAFAVAFDSTGTIVWYKEFPVGLSSVALAQQPNGNYTIYLGNSDGSSPVPGSYIEFTPAGDQVRVWTAPNGSYMDPHELLLTVDTDGQPIAHMTTYTIRSIDATSVGGSSSEQLAQHALQRLKSAGAPVAVWDSWNHFTLADWIEPPKFGPHDIDHLNSVTIAPDGNYIVSWRNTGEITKIDAVTGAAIWRLGGRNNQFTFIGDPLGGFSAQHYVRMTPQGTILLYDNGWRHAPQQTRGVEYKLDETAKTATMIHEWRHHH